jgi:hypothetical protein
MNVRHSFKTNESDVGRPLVGLLSVVKIFIYYALETHKGPPYIFCINAMRSPYKLIGLSAVWSGGL